MARFRAGYKGGREMTSAEKAGFRNRAQAAGMTVTATTPLSAVANWARGNQNKGGRVGRTATSLYNALGGSM